MWLLTITEMIVIASAFLESNRSWTYPHNSPSWLRPTIWCFYASSRYITQLFSLTWNVTRRKVSTFVPSNKAKATEFFLPHFENRKTIIYLVRSLAMKRRQKRRRLITILAFFGRQCPTYTMILIMQRCRWPRGFTFWILMDATLSSYLVSKTVSDIALFQPTIVSLSHESIF